MMVSCLTVDDDSDGKCYVDAHAMMIVWRWWVMGDDGDDGDDDGNDGDGGIVGGMMVM